jgi:hypothetical protein
MCIRVFFISANAFVQRVQFNLFQERIPYEDLIGTFCRSAIRYGGV